MPRLRTTTALSLLALLVGIAGTSWLSTLTATWPGSPTQFVHGTPDGVPAAHALPTREPPQNYRRVVPRHVVASHPLVKTDSARDPASVSATGLVPLSMPADTSQPWSRLRGHLDGRLSVHLVVDAQGRVSAASLGQSSGDPMLDEHALRSVRRWRFAVPPDHPEGVSGELPMRFSSHPDGVARAP